MCQVDVEMFESTRLVIPNKVGARMFKSTNSKHLTANLRVGRSCLWDVKVRSSGKTVYLDEGCLILHELKPGLILLFELVLEFVWEVTIFHKSMVEAPLKCFECVE